ncbi:ParA family protein [uncultured Chryseobacterium sp.]|uniref:ParA family protein n=1 Tax=uncultured Chryseobacterium sp. TaxID=259322 RepID=UPI0026006848|nr:ParA family protein [uncultured Chryseobacterium sp.]
MTKVILVSNQKGGVGKSTMTFNLAVNLHQTAKICIVDMDYQGSIISSRKFDGIPVYSADKLKEVLEQDYQFVFIDTPPYLADYLPELCKRADVIIIPTKAGVYDILAIQPTIGIIKEAKAENKALIFFNMVKPNTSLTSDIKTQLEKYGIKTAKTMISDLVAFGRSPLLKGVEGNVKAQKQIDSLTKEVLMKILS